MLAKSMSSQYKATPWNKVKPPTGLGLIQMNIVQFMQTFSTF